MVLLFSIIQSRVITEVFVWEPALAVTALASPVAGCRFADWAALLVQ
jgi:hypothetical protein